LRIAETTAFVNGDEVLEDAMVEMRWRDLFSMEGRRIWGVLSSRFLFGMKYSSNEEKKKEKKMLDLVHINL